MNVPQACLPPPHNLDSPSTRWEGPCAAEYVPVDHGVHLGRITKRQKKNKLSNLIQSSFVFIAISSCTLEKHMMHIPLGPCASCGCCSLPKTRWASEPAWRRSALAPPPDRVKENNLTLNYTSQLHLTVSDFEH